MIVFRLIAGTRTERIETDKARLVLGASPTADVTLAGVGWPAEAAILEVLEATVRLRRASADGAETAAEVSPRILAPGDRADIGAVRLDLLQVGAATAPVGLPRFGDYEDPLADGPDEMRTFALAPDEDAGTPAPAPVLAVAPPPPPTPAPKAPAPQAAPPQAAPPQAAPPQAAPPQAAPPQAAPPPAAGRPGRGGPTREKEQTPVAAGFPAPTVAQEFLAQLRRAPFFVFSAALHALLLLVISLLVDTTSETASQLGTITTSLGEDEDFGETEETVETFDLSELEIDDQNEPEALLFRAPPEESAESPTPAQEHFRAEFDDVFAEAPDSHVGVLPSSAALHAKTPRRTQISSVPPKVLAQEFRGMGTAPLVNQRAAQAVRDMLGRGRTGYGAALDDIRGEDLLVVTGGFDSIEDVLTALNLPFVKVAPWDLKKPGGVDFSKHKVVFWNCGERLEGRALRRISRQLERFVRGGGYLFTTDWSVSYVLAEAFPGYLTSNGRAGVRLPDMIVDIRPHPRTRGHPLLEGVFLAGVKGRWWLEEMSFDVGIGSLGEGVVDVLIESPLLRDQYGRSPIVAATFPYGRGRVLHAMGHYFQKAGNVAGTIASHRLAMNFVLQRMAQDR